MTDFQLDYVFRMETATEVKFGPEYELILTVECDGDWFELTMIEAEDMVITHKDITVGNLSPGQSDMWRIAEHDLNHNDDIRAKAWHQFQEAA